MSDYLKMTRSYPYELVTWQPSPAKPLPALLFVHGATLDYRWWEEAFILAFVAAGYTCHAMSLPYHESTRGWYVGNFVRMRYYVQSLGALIEHLGEKPVLVGHSMGGYVVQKYLEGHQAPAAILLASIPAHGFWQITIRLFRDYFPEVVWDAIRLKRDPFRPDPEHFRRLCFAPSLPKEQLMTYYKHLHWESFPAMFDMLLFDLPKVNLIRQSGTPMLVLGAEHDTTIGRGEVLATARAYGADYDIVPGVQHSMIHEAGWERVAARMLHWLHEQTC
jgi:pimeloyl-ACP methyl ester carboxylesterase